MQAVFSESQLHSSFSVCFEINLVADYEDAIGVLLGDDSQRFIYVGHCTWWLFVDLQPELWRDLVNQISSY